MSICENKVLISKSWYGPPTLHIKLKEKEKKSGAPLLPELNYHSFIH